MKKTFTWYDPAFPPILFSFTIWWNKLSILEWHCCLRKAHIPHNYSCYWPQVHQRESNLGYLAEALRRVLSVSLASVGLHHHQSCVVYLCLNPSKQSQRGQTSGHTAAQKTAPMMPGECGLIVETTSWVHNERNPPIRIGCKVPLACFLWEGIVRGGGLDGLLTAGLRCICKASSGLKLWIVEITELSFLPSSLLPCALAGFCVPLSQLNKFW